MAAIAFGALLVAAPVGADRVVSEIPIPGTAEMLNQPGSLAMLPSGDLAFAWARKGRIHLARYRHKHWSTKIRDKVYGSDPLVDVVFDDMGRFTFRGRNHRRMG